MNGHLHRSSPFLEQPTGPRWHSTGRALLLLLPHRFELVLRNVQSSSAGSAEEAEAAVAAAAEALRRSGFINYYGLQRFGSGAVPTHR